MKMYKILGHDVDVDRIRNPALRRVMDGRFADFMFAYVDFFSPHHIDNRWSVPSPPFEPGWHEAHQDIYKDYYTDYSDSGGS